MRVREGLDQVPTGVLRRIAASHGLPADEAATRTELIDRLAERLADPVYVAELIASLADDEREALVAARASGGEMRGLLIDRDQPGAATALVDRGLLFRTFAAAGPRRGEIFSLPDEVLEVLPAPPATEAPPAHAAPPAERRTSDPAFSLFALASSLSRAGANLDADVRGWSAEPGGFAASERWHFLHHLASAAGLLDEHGAVPALRRLLNDPVALTERLRRTYVQDRAWSELTAIGLDPSAGVANPTLVRAALLETVDALPEDAWISLADLSEWLQRTRPDLLREQLDARGLLLVEARPWSELEGALVRHVLLGPAYWLGLMAASADGLLVARRGAPKALPAEPCRWDEEHDGRVGEHLLAPARARLGTLLQAERYLILDERNRVSRYHLAQPHVAAALGSGGSVDECRRLLTRLSDGPLPEHVERLLGAWRARYGALSVRPAVVLDARSEEELQAALDEATVQPFIQRRLGPTSAEVAAADALALAHALRASGHLPRIDAALRLASDARRSYAGLIDEQVLEFLLVSLLAFQQVRPERLAELEGALGLLGRLEQQFPSERLRALRVAADRLAGDLRSSPPRPRATRRRLRPGGRPPAT